ncbi:MAG TPA: glycoside hydrolase family 15 protein [Pyrinomonadaceae bacterium]|nr:glycoside hydrolase family 15 protein [Pyrinomonadaceae bacterium]
MKTPKYRKLIQLVCLSALMCDSGFSQKKLTLAPGAPGGDAHWMSAGKQAVGTSNTLESKVWFTLEGGAMTEVFYPTVDTPNVRLLQFVVVNPKTKIVETEKDDAIHKIEAVRPDSLTFRQTNTAKSGAWKIVKTYTSEPQRNSVLINVAFTPLKADFELYVYYDPSINNSGMRDTAWTRGKALLASDGDKVSALLCNRCEFAGATNGFFGTSDGIEQLKRDGKITNQYSRAENGNVVQLALINSKFPINSHKNFELVLSFGKTPAEALQSAAASSQKGFLKTNREYNKSWSDYARTLPQVEPKYRAQFDMAAMILKAHEDKTFRGASVAALSNPWGGGNNSNETTSGYHLVWSRDLYQAATAFMALGDKAAAARSLEYLFKYQQKPDGSFPQITWLDGRTVGDSIQMDEVSYPLILAYQLGKTDRETYENNIKKSADYIVKAGPKSQQERWEEKAGYSPSTIAAEIAALVCAAEIARINGDETSAEIYLKTADDWARNVEKWTATTSGKYGDGNYYLRLTKNGTPDAGDKIELDGTFDEREIVDAGFLELVRLGIKSPNDLLIQKSLKVIDRVIKVNTPHGDAWYRYNHDGYGETYDGKRWNWDGTYKGKGHLWALLSGERGQFEIAECGKRKAENGRNPRVGRNVKVQPANECLNKAKTRLDSMLGFANEASMIPEQVWDKSQTPNADLQFMPPLKFGGGTGSARPLAWSMAQFIRLTVNLRAGRNLDTPDVVAKRYGNFIR